jgi:arylsulfatase A-like enzyme
MAVGALVAAGWILHDTAVFVAGPRPEAVLSLLAGFSVAFVALSLLGALLALGERVVVAAALLALGLGAAPWVVGLTSPAQEHQPILVLVFVAAWYVARWIVVRRESWRWAAAGLGALAAAGSGAALGAGDQIQGPVASAGLLWLIGSIAPSRLWKLVAVVALLGVFFLLYLETRINLRHPRPDLEPPGAAAPAGAPSALLIVLDTVRADRMSAYGHERDTTPGLDAFARDHATRYDEARSTSSWTLPSHASLFTGLFPGEHGVTHPRGGDLTRGATWVRPPPPTTAVPTLAERLRSRGYQTAAIVANNMLGSWSGLDRGFERYDDRKSVNLRGYHLLGQVGGRRELIGHRPYRDAGVITDLALAWLDEERREEPFFLMLNYMDAHTPYAPPKPFDRMFSDERPDDPTASQDLALAPLLYDRELAYLDAEVTRLLDGLAERGLLDDVLVVVTSDHGEAFGEHDTWAHDWTLYEEQLRVPLLVKPPGGRSAPVETEPVTGADVHDLVLEHLGVELEEREPRGGLVGEWYYTETLHKPAGIPGRTEEEMARDLLAWTEAGRKVIVSSTGEVEAFDLASDPGELRPLELDAEELEAARARAQAWWTANPPPPPSDTTLDAATIGRLRDLGYVGEEEE